MHMKEQPEKGTAPRHVPNPPEQAAAVVRLPLGDMSPAALVSLQRTAGNAAVARMVEERRRGAGADRADAPAVQRSTVHDTLNSAGRPLDGPLRTEMEDRLGADFADVTLHTGAGAQRAAADVGARAFTSGNHVVIGDGGADKHTLAHELIHVIQQRRGPVAGTDDGTGLRISDPSDRFEREAEAGATEALRGEPTRTAEASAPVQDETRAGAPVAPVQRVKRSASQAHLDLPFHNAELAEQGPHQMGVHGRFHTPTPALTDEQRQDGRLRRQITPDQAEQYKRIQQEVIAKEDEHGADHYPFFHAQDPRIRVAQDIYKKVYSHHHGEEVPEDFHFLRYPGPKDTDYAQYENMAEFFETDMKQHGLIDDNIVPTKSSIISANLSLHGGLNHSGEETFHYFQVGKGQTEIPVASFIEDFLTKFGLDTSGVARIYQEAEALNDTAEGSLFQILVPKQLADDVAYIAHPHGLPHDDELLDDLHTLGPIRYDKPTASSLEEPDGTRSGLPVNNEREKMNDEITRNLHDVREVWNEDVEEPSPVPDRGTFPPGPGTTAKQVEAARPELAARTEQRRKWRLKQQATELHDRTVERFRQGAYAPTNHLDDYVNEPEKLSHPELPRQRELVEQNPEHFQGQGKKSRHEMMRVANRQNFMQARVLLSEKYMLNPRSGIKIVRHTTMDEENAAKYEKLLAGYVEKLFAEQAANRQNPGD
ncbi:DUF4157 domain-containing protein [Streptomyces sp. NPDC021093]|uniref:DUF4157 domain-containing protein n=1 Tax=Streptomyces sp. NPDC021093 TaxID=3365112 RepID=UPI00379C18FD